MNKKLKKTKDMRKILTIILCGLMMAQFAKADDRKIYLLDANGKLYKESVSDVEYITFAPEDDWLTMEASVEESRAAYVDLKIAATKRSDIKSFDFPISVGVLISHKWDPLEEGSGYYRATLGDTTGVYNARLDANTKGMKDYWRTNSDNYVRAYIQYLDKVVYTDLMTFSTPVENSATMYDCQWIDLQLPSGTLWMSTNLGADCAADKGNLYQWSSSKLNTTCSDATYEYYTHGEYSSYYYPTKYCSSDNLVETSRKKNDAEASTYFDDAVENLMYIASGKDGSTYYYLDMYVASKADYEELLDESNCTWTVKTQKASDGTMVKGYEVKSIRNNATIFFPFKSDNDDTGYWTRNLDAESVAEGNYNVGTDLIISENKKMLGHTTRPTGLLVRGVYQRKD